jgi:pyruvate/2-oxoglutarate dehydrogenase complex dihydrolipoamide acyltransferase (E2) component
MPALSPTMTQGNIARWVAKEVRRAMAAASGLGGGACCCACSGHARLGTFSAIGLVWRLQGDEIGPGDVLCEIETDKATLAFEAQDEGVLAKIVVPAGTNDVPVGKLLAIMVSSKAEVGAFKTYTEGGGAPAAKAAVAAAPAATPVPAATSTPAASTVACTPLNSPTHSLFQQSRHDALVGQTLRTSRWRCRRSRPP